MISKNLFVSYTEGHLAEQQFMYLIILQISDSSINDLKETK